MAITKRGVLRKIVYVLIVAATATVGLLGWNWLNGLELRTIRVSGNGHAVSDDLIALAAVDTGAALFGIDPSMIADRVQRHPWVKSAAATRIPPGLLSINVVERTPVMLVIDSNGVPSAYVDGEGYSMPLTPQSSFDVPLLKGVKLPASPAQPIENQAVLELLRDVTTIDPDADVLISSFEIEPSGQLALRTEPINGQGSIYVRLGRRDYAARLSYLSAFWRQAVLTRPDRKYEWIDLRFDSQIVTRETSGT